MIGYLAPVVLKAYTPCLVEFLKYSLTRAIPATEKYFGAAPQYTEC